MEVENGLLGEKRGTPAKARTVVKTPTALAYSMSLKNPNEDESTDVRLPSDASKLGVDGNGATHYFSAYRSTAIVHEADEKVRTFDLDNTPCENIEEWIGHVKTQRGDWRDLYYHEGDPLSHLIEQIGRFE